MEYRLISSGEIFSAYDVPVTYADTNALEKDYGFKANTSLRTGLRKFAKWYKNFYNV